MKDFCKTLFERVKQDSQRKIDETRSKIDSLYEELDERKRILKAQTEEQCAITADTVLREFFNLPIEEQESIRKEFIEPTILKIDKPKKKRGRPRKNDAIEQALLRQEDETPSELIPDLSAEDLIRVNSPCVVTEKENEDDEALFYAVGNNCVIQNHDDAENQQRELLIFGKTITNLEIGDDVISFFEKLFNLGRFNLKEAGEEISPNKRQDLWLIICEKAREALWKATNGALQIQYYIKDRKKYPFYETAPYEAIWVRVIKPGKLSRSQEAAFEKSINAYQEKFAPRT